MTDAPAPTRRFERSPALSRVIIPAARALARGYFRVRVEHADRIPADRPVIYVGKHPRTFLYLETVILGLVTFWDSGRPPFRVLEKSNTSIHRTPLLGWMRRNVNAVPATEDAALDALAHGESLLIFPGGTRELYGPPDELRWERRTGFARLAIRAGVPLQPFAIAGADRQHPWRVAPGGVSVWLPPVPLPVRLTYRFGQPLMPSPDEDAERFAARAESATSALLAGGD
ncbi:MAG TPA: 1-acyl-sn-glycerol-3-phosphate acyltransferase [Gemmatimonadaceae bacterium]|nr:1-acyl-sn-glycerol-3-phosphate acyltransferase [Gemmatimonadaceae bacterium]